MVKGGRVPIARPQAAGAHRFPIPDRHFLGFSRARRSALTRCDTPCDPGVARCAWHPVLALPGSGTVLPGRAIAKRCLDALPTGWRRRGGGVGMRRARDFPGRRESRAACQRDGARSGDGSTPPSHSVAALPRDAAGGCHLSHMCLVYGASCSGSTPSPRCLLAHGRTAGRTRPLQPPRGRTSTVRRRAPGGARQAGRAGSG